MFKALLSTIALARLVPVAAVLITGCSSSETTNELVDTAEQSEAVVAPLDIKISGRTPLYTSRVQLATFLNTDAAT